METKNFVGGRGVKAPYKTSVLRVPVPLLPAFEMVMDRYRQKIANGSPVSDETTRSVVLAGVENSLDRDKVIESAKKILKQRKSAKHSILKLLQVIVEENIQESDLID